MPTPPIDHAIMTILADPAGGISIGVGGGGVVGAVGAGITVLYARHPRGGVVADSLGVVLVPGPGLSRVHVVAVHVVGLGHTRGLAVGAAEGLGLGRRDGLVDAGLGRRQWLVV